jgi:cell division protein FtsB
MTGGIAIAMDERQKRQRARNRALLVVLVALVAAFYFLAMFRVGGPH